MKACFVGIGSIAKRHIKNLSEICRERGIDIQIDALRRSASKDAPALQAIRDTYTSVEQLPTDYDVIFLTNPTEYHADMLIALHDHAKHFFIEKPVASLESVEKLNRISFREDSVYYVACPLRYTNVIQYLKQTINVKSVYAVRSISSSYLPDWRPETDYRNTYSAHKALGGGVDIDLIHEWDYLTYLFGMPTEVSCFSGKISKLDIDSCDYAIYIAQYGNNMVSELHLDYFGQSPIRQVEIFAEKETIRGDLLKGTVEYLRAGKMEKFPTERDVYQKRELQYFLDTIKSGNHSQNDIKNAIKILKLTQGMVE